MLSRAYLTDDNIPLAAQMYDFIGHAILAIPEFGSQTDWKHIGDYNRGPFQVGFRTELGYMEYLQANPQRIKSWNAGMRLGRIGHRTSAFPFQKALELDPPAGNGGIAVVDVGGGRGQALEGIRQDYPDIKGRMILLDLPGVITDAKNNGLPQYIETAPGSFFDPLPEGKSTHRVRLMLYYPILTFSGRSTAIPLSPRPPHLGPTKGQGAPRKHQEIHGRLLARCHCRHGSCRCRLPTRFGHAGPQHDEPRWNGAVRVRVERVDCIGWLGAQQDLVQPRWAQACGC